MDFIVYGGEKWGGKLAVLSVRWVKNEFENNWCG